VVCWAGFEPVPVPVLRPLAIAPPKPPEVDAPAAGDSVLLVPPTTTTVWLLLFVVKATTVVLEPVPSVIEPPAVRVWDPMMYWDAEFGVIVLEAMIIGAGEAVALPLPLPAPAAADVTAATGESVVLLVPPITTTVCLWLFVVKATTVVDEPDPRVAGFPPGVSVWDPTTIWDAEFCVRTVEPMTIGWSVCVGEVPAPAGDLLVLGGVD
jgi:hypothetical protein